MSDESDTEARRAREAQAKFYQRLRLRLAEKMQPILDCEDCVIIHDEITPCTAHTGLAMKAWDEAMDEIKAEMSQERGG